MNISKKQIHKLVLESLLLEGKYSTLIDLFKKAFNVNRVSDVPIKVMNNNPALENMYNKMKNIELSGVNTGFYGEAVGTELVDYKKMERALQRKLSGKPPSSPSPVRKTTAPARKTTVATKAATPKITTAQIDNLVNSPDAAQKLIKVANSKEAAKIFDLLIDLYEVKKVNEWSLIKKYITRSKDYKDVVKYKDQIILKKADLIKDFNRLGIEDKQDMKSIIMNATADNIAFRLYDKIPQELTNLEKAEISALRKKINSFINDIGFYKTASNKFSEESKNRIIRFFTWFGKNPIKTIFIATAAIAVLGVSVVISGVAAPAHFAKEIFQIYTNSELSWTLMTYHKIRRLFGKKMPPKFQKQEQINLDYKKIVKKAKKKKKWTAKDIKDLQRDADRLVNAPIQ